MKAHFTKTRIAGIITLIPPKSIDIDSELDSIYKGDIKALNRIKKVVGLQKRHIADSHITASDMGEAAANILLDFLKIPRESIDALIFVTQTPDYILPASACYLHGRLNLATSCLSFDINQACAGYLYGLYVAHSFIEGGGAERVLLIVGDTISKFVNPLDSNLAPIIGDGVSATLLERTQTKRDAFFELGSDGKKFYQLIIPEGAGRIPTKDIIQEEKVWQTSPTRTLKNLYMDGAEIFNFAVMTYPNTFTKILEFANLEKEALDFCFFHQANKYIVDNITKRLGLDPKKVPNTTTNKYGNLSGCSVPATICDTLAQDLAESNLDTALHRQKYPLLVHLAGFGAGLSFGNAILSLDEDFACKKVQIYRDNTNHTTKENP